MPAQFSRKALTGAIKQVINDDQDLKDYIKQIISQNKPQNKLTQVEIDQHTQLKKEIRILIDELNSQRLYANKVKSELEEEINKARRAYTALQQTRPKY